MAYSPALNDIQEIENISPTTNYSPSVNDVPVNETLSGSVTRQPSVGFGQNLMNVLNNLGQGGLDVLSGVAKAGMGIANTPHNIVNLFSPRIAANIPTSPINSNDINQLFGTQNPGLYGKLLEGAGQYLPFAAGGEALGASGLLGDTATGAAYGATQTQNPLSGGAKAGALNAALSVIPGGIGLAAKGLNYLKPADFADQIVNQLGQGKSLEDNAQSLAQDIYMH